MNNKELLKKLVMLIKLHKKKDGTRWRNEDIAAELGYTRSYFQTLLGGKGVVTEQHLKDFYLRFTDSFGEAARKELLETGIIPERIDSNTFEETLTDHINSAKTESKISSKSIDSSKVNVFISYSAEELGEILKDYIRLVKMEDVKKRSARGLKIDAAIESYYKTKYINLLVIINSLNLNTITINQAIEIIELNGDKEWLSIKGTEAIDMSKG